MPFTEYLQINYLRGEIGLRRFLRNSPTSTLKLLPPFCHSSWEDKQMKGSIKQIPGINLINLINLRFDKKTKKYKLIFNKTFI